MRRSLRTALAAAILLVLPVAARADVIVTFHDGKEIRTASVTYENGSLKLDDGKSFPRNLIKCIALVHKQPAADKPGAQKPQDVEELLRTAQEAVKQFPDAKQILLVDHGYEEKRADGTWVFRYRTASKILHPDALSMAARSLGFEEEREKARIIQARSIDPDGTVHNYDPASVKTSEPSRGAVHFGRGKRMTYQIPQVKVGSIVDYTHEYEVFNPYDPEMFFAQWSFAGTEPFIHSRLQVVMPREQKLYFVTRNMPQTAQKPRLMHGQGTTAYIWEMRNQPGVVEETYMPPVSDVVPRIVCSPFADWSYIKNWSSERLVPRMEMHPALKQLVAALTKDLTEPEEKIAALYHWVQRNIQYVSIKGSIASGMCGHPASETFENKYGDCIDCAILFCTLLRIAGIEAYPVWVSTNDISSVVTELPTIGGNHAITEIHLDDKVFFLDPTATGYRYPAFRSDDHGIYAINPILAKLTYISVPDPSENMRSCEMTIKLTPDGDASVKYLSVRTGSYEAGARGDFMRANEQQLAKFFRSRINEYSPGARLLGYEIKNTEDYNKQLEWHMSFALPRYAASAGDLLVVKIPGIEYSFPEAALRERKYDIDYKTSEEIKHKAALSIPEGFDVKYLPPKIELSSKYITYRASYTLESGARSTTVTFEDDFRQVTRFVPVSDYASHRELLQKINRYAKQPIFFERAK